MTETEMRVIQEHLVYRKVLADRKIVVVFGPVADPKETYGLAIVEAEDEAVAYEFGIQDPCTSMVLYRVFKKYCKFSKFFLFTFLAN
jgi:uncharacterized protein YciI